MKLYLLILTAAASLAFCDASAAQAPPQFAGPEKEHQWLQKFVGQWETEAKASMGPDQPPMECKGTMNARMLGGFWLVSEIKAEPAGMPMNALQTIGYDPAKQKYVGTWVDSMMNHLWLYEGSVDPSGKILTMEAEGPNMMAEGKLTKFRDTYEFKSADHIVSTSSMLDENGKWITFMTGHSKRKP